MTIDEYAAASKRHRPGHIRYANYYVWNYSDAVELVDHVIESCLAECGVIRNYEKYMARVIRFRALNYLRDHRLHTQYEVPLIIDDEGEPIAAMVRYESDEDLRLDVRAVLLALPAQLRNIAYLIYMEGWTQKELAVRLQMTPMQMSRLVGEVNGLLRIALQAYRAEAQ